MKITLPLAALLASTALSLPAAAQTFGPRIEVRAGSSSAEAEGGALPKQDSDAAAYGVAAGYDVALGSRIYLGVDAGFDWSEHAFETQEGTTTTRANVESQWEVGGRIGVRATESLRVYARAAYVSAAVEGEIVIGGTTGPTRTVVSDDLDGLRYGVGAEYDFGETLFAKLELQHADFDDLAIDGAVVGLGWRF